MTRCDYDNVFHRVFCVTLLAIAFTFTVILTNVFIDIDGLLANKEKDRPEFKDHEQITYNEKYKKEDSTAEPKSESSYEFKTEKEDDEANHRTKRSLDTKPFQSQLKDPKIKQILTDKLATLLEELDAEETHATRKMDLNKNQDLTKIFQKIVDKKEEKGKDNSENKLLHLAMHNILLQGIIGHMDFNDVYKKVHVLMKSFDKNGRRTGDDEDKIVKTGEKTELSNPDISSNTFCESKFFQELLECEDLQKDILEAAVEKENKQAINTRRAYGGLMGKQKGRYINEGDMVDYEKQNPHMLIKTVIDIKTLKNDRNKTNINANNIKGLIQLIYNGKPVKFSGFEEEPNRDEKEQARRSQDTETIDQSQDISQNTGNMAESFLDKAISNYLMKHPKLNNEFKSKRMKRNVKTRDNEKEAKNKNKTENNENIKNKKKSDEELYVEIETHFDSKGVKGEKKKKLIKNLVEKIQKAIRADIHSFHVKTKRHKLSIKKREQSPLETNSDKYIKDKILVGRDIIIHRNLDPITKTIESESKPKVYGKSAENWKKSYYDLDYLTNNKAMNSHEINPVDLDYFNTGIPERLQQPLNSLNEVIREESNNGNFFNLGDLKFYIKEIDGTGFSIGFNQYVGEAPDPENIKLFTGLQQLIQTYHQNYDDGDNRNDITNIEKNKSIESYHEIKKREVNDPTAELFKDEPVDYHLNEYKVEFGNRNLPYDSYSEIIEDQNKKITLDVKKEDDKHDNLYTHNISKSELPFIFDDNIFGKKLKPSEIFVIASLLDRKKRSPAALVKVKKFSNVNLRKKSKLNRFIKSHRKSKRILVNKNRSKRQIDKIRIIAADTLPDLQRHSGENVFVISEKNIANRNMLREIEEPEREAVEPSEDQDYSHHHHVYEASPQPYYNQYVPPHISIFAGRSRHNALMSKYPHLILDELTEDDSPQFYSRLLNSYSDWQKNAEITAPPFLATPIPNSDLGSVASDIAEGISPNAKYKLTVKIVPKNSSDDIHSGFKEIHTSINKSINRNGLLYSSQVNVSEISKIENLNPKEIKSNSVAMNNSSLNASVGEVAKKMETSTSYYPLVKHIREQQEKMKTLLKQHRLKIDEQLDSLKKEKQNIESIIVPIDRKLEMIDVMLPLSPPQVLHLNKEEAGQLISSALMKLNNAPPSNDKTTTTNSSQNNTQTINNSQPTHSTPDPEKLKILKTIQRNENLTNIILFKIDKNTNLLQEFLQKLSEKVQTTTQNPEMANPENAATAETKRKGDWKNPYIQEQFFGQNLKKIEELKNSTHMTIPFVYAYQQPYHVNNKDKDSNHVANVIYQGHIHTPNAFDNNENLKNRQDFRIENKSKKVMPGKREINQSRFYFDGLDSDYKLEQVLPVKAFDISRMKNTIAKVNMTGSYTLL